MARQGWLSSLFFSPLPLDERKAARRGPNDVRYSDAREHISFKGGAGAVASAQPCEHIGAVSWSNASAAAAAAARQSRGPCICTAAAVCSESRIKAML